MDTLLWFFLQGFVFALVIMFVLYTGYQMLVGKKTFGQAVRAFGNFLLDQFIMEVGGLTLFLVFVYLMATFAG